MSVEKLLMFVVLSFVPAPDRQAPRAFKLRNTRGVLVCKRVWIPTVAGKKRLSCFFSAGPSRLLLYKKSVTSQTCLFRTPRHSSIICGVDESDINDQEELPIYEDLSVSHANLFDLYEQIVNRISKNFDDQDTMLPAVNAFVKQCAYLYEQGETATTVALGILQASQTMQVPSSAAYAVEFEFASELEGGEETTLDVNGILLCAIAALSVFETLTLLGHRRKKNREVLAADVEDFITALSLESLYKEMALQVWDWCLEVFFTYKSRGDTLEKVKGKVLYSSDPYAEVEPSSLSEEELQSLEKKRNADQILYLIFFRTIELYDKQLRPY
eukprot:CAMPEP_0196663394 /NCGR_PEP_ID=MMETSP1086-20130531/52682_1 /TAXON_ID=77921 /ORGANISM="Cyanoptyche  gloeocystis , Strain SAG4.97" /LENGTH=327 /DNA_ID=CAMNT_0041999189 /DNA_START=12 /DNA_END=995 /DNA_ORIENTATION=+